MTLILRKQRSQEQLEGRQHFHDWKDTDYAVVDGMRRVGRIYQDQLPGGEKWMWFLHVLRAARPNGGSADTLEEAMHAFKAAYERGAKGRP